ncbi:MAG: hypothetical protein AAGC91_01090 [Pseudomonadota bacterium]
MTIREQFFDLVLRARNALSRPTADAADSVSNLATTAESLQQELRNLEDQGRLISEFRRASTAVDRTRASYDRAQLRLDRLADRIGRTGVVTRRQAQEFEVAQRAVDVAQRSYADAESTLERLGSAASEAGIDIGNLSEAQRSVQQQTTQAKRALEDFESEAASAGDEAQRLSGRVREGALSLGRWAAAAAAASVALVTASVTRFTTNQADLARQTLASAEAFGVSATELQEWQAAAQAVGIEGDKAADILKDVSERIGDAFETGGGEAAEIIDRLGLSIENLVALSPDEQILAIAQELEGLPRPSQIQVLEALASDAALLLPLLEDNASQLRELTSAARDRGSILSDDELRTLAEANTAIRGLRQRFQAFIQDIAVRLAPSFTELANRIDQAIGSTPGLVDRVADAFQDLITVAQEWAVAAIDNAGPLVDGFTRLVNTIGSAVRGIAAVKDEIILLGKAWVGIQIAGIISSARLFGATLLGSVATGAAAATRAVIALRVAILRLPFVGLAAALIDTGFAIGTFIREKLKLDDSLAEGARIQAEATERIAQFREQTGLAAESLDDLIAAQEAGIAIYDEVNERWIGGAEAVKEYKASLEGVTDATNQAANATENAFTSAIDNAVSSFATLRRQTGSTRQALNELFGRYDLRATESVEELLTALGRLREDGQITAQDIRQALGSALDGLSAQELNAFAVNVRNAFEQGRISAEEFSDALGGSVSAALRDLGVDIALAESGISTLGRQSIDAFQLVVDQIDQTGDSAEIQSRKIRDSFLQAFQNIRTDAGRLQLLEALNQALRQGTIGFQDYQAAINASNEALARQGGAQAEVTEQVDRTTSALQRLRAEQQQTNAEVQDAGVSGGAAYEILTQAIAGYTAQLEQLGDRAVDAWERIVTGARGTAQPVDELDSRLAEVNERLRELSFEGARVFDATGLRSQLIDMAEAARTVERSFLEQSIALRDLGAQYESGAVGAEQFIARAEQMLQTSDLLNDQDLENLTAGIDRAKEAMDRLRGSAESTLTGLQDRLDRLQGNTEAIERRNFEQQIADLEAQLEEARFFRNDAAVADLEESLRIAQQIFDIEQQRRVEAERTSSINSGSEQGVQVVAEPRQASPVQATPIEQTSNQVRVVRLELGTGGQQLGALNVVDDGSVESFLDAIERQGLALAASS